MKKAKGLVLLSVGFALVTAGGLLHGCGSKEEVAPAASSPTPTGAGGTTAPSGTTPSAAKFTIVGAGK